MPPIPLPVRLLAEVLAVVGVAQAVLLAAFPGIAGGLPAGERLLLGVVLLLFGAGPAVYWRCMARARQAPPPVQRGTRLVGGVASAIAMAAAAQALGLLLTAGAVVWQQRSVDAAAQVRFDRDVERIHNEVGRHFAMPLYALNGLRAMLRGTSINLCSSPV